MAKGEFIGLAINKPAVLHQLELNKEHADEKLAEVIALQEEYQNKRYEVWGDEEKKIDLILEALLMLQASYEKRCDEVDAGIAEIQKYKPEGQ